MAAKRVNPSSPCRRHAVSSALPSTCTPVSVRTFKFSGFRTLRKQASRGFASTRMRSWREARCSLKSRWWIQKHCSSGRPESGSSRAPRLLSGPRKEARHTARCLPQNLRAAVKTSVDLRLVRISSRRGAFPKVCTKFTSKGDTVSHRSLHIAERSAGKTTERADREDSCSSGADAPDPSCSSQGFHSASSRCTQPCPPRSMNTVCTAGQYSLATTVWAICGGRSEAMLLRW
mmetsp:Transcript_33089/g.88746  ORF Transcript_33089/g.88746 Transcript_33089/m.88746 type:complete len:232 (+) Transcript_33089:621-1316(+)